MNNETHVTFQKRFKNVSVTPQRQIQTQIQRQTQREDTLQGESYSHVSYYSVGGGR